MERDSLGYALITTELQRGVRTVIMMAGLGIEKFDLSRMYGGRLRQPLVLRSAMYEDPVIQTLKLDSYRDKISRPQKYLSAL